MNALELRNKTELAISHRQADAKKSIENMLSFAAEKGCFDIFIGKDRRLIEYNFLNDGYDKELINLGFAVRLIGKDTILTGFKISWENAK